MENPIKLKPIDNLDNFWKFWSTRFNIVAGACGIGVTTYAGFKTLAPETVAGIPHWALLAMGGGGTIFTMLAFFSRGVKQEKLQ